MEMITRNVKDIETADRQALEHVISQHPADDQQLVIHVAKMEALPQDTPTDSVPTTGSLPDWCNVYQGLTDKAISSLEETVLKRAELSRTTD